MCYYVFLALLSYSQVDGGDTSDEEKMALFTEYNLTNIKTDTYMKLEDLHLVSGQKYYAFVLG